MSINNISGLKDPDSKKDVNFFRKISKYDLDKQSVNWSKLIRERNRQNAQNAKVLKEEIL